MGSPEKCDLPYCSVYDNTSKLVICKAFCKRKFHGPCMGAPRDWFHASLLEYFICVDCQDTQQLLRTMFEGMVKCVSDLNHEKDGLIKKQQTTIEANAFSFREMSRNFENLLKELDVTTSNLMGLSDKFKTLPVMIENTLHKCLDKKKTFDESAVIVDEVNSMFDKLTVMIDNIHEGINVTNQATLSETTAIKNSLQDLKADKVDDDRSSTASSSPNNSDLSESPISNVQLTDVLELPQPQTEFHAINRQTNQDTKLPNSHNESSLKSQFNSQSTLENSSAIPSTSSDFPSISPSVSPSKKKRKSKEPKQQGPRFSFYHIKGPSTDIDVDNIVQDIAIILEY